MTAAAATNVPVLQVLEQAGYVLGQVRQAAQQPDGDTGRCGDRHPPPLAPEPARIRIGVPLASVGNHAHEDQAGEGAEDPENDRVSHQRPESRSG